MNAYYGPPAPWGYQPPPDPRQDEILRKAQEVAIRWYERKEREKERSEKLKKKERIAAEKVAAAKAARRLLFIETYVLGIVSYPIWAPIVSALIRYLHTL